MVKNNFISVLLLILTACHTGIDYAVLPLNPNDFVDYGDRVKNKKIPPGPMAYGLAKQGVLEGGKSNFNQELENIAIALKTIKDLPLRTTFTSSQAEELNKFIVEVEKIIYENIKPKMLNATLSHSSAVELLIEIEKNIKHQGNLISLIDAMRNDIPLVVIKEFENAERRLKVSFENIYQQCILYSQAIAQKKVLGCIFDLKSSLLQLEENAGLHVIFDDESQSHDAHISLMSSISKTNELSKLAGLMTATNKVKKGLVESIVELKTSLFGINGLEERFIAKVVRAYRTSVEFSLNELKRIVEELEFAINNYDESPKSTSEAALQSLHQAAFSGKFSVVLEPVSMPEESDLERFMRLLGQHKVMGLYADEASEAFIESLSVAVVHGIAENYGAHIDNVYSLNSVKLNETKASYKMSESSWRDYLLGISMKIFKETNKIQSAHVYVLFADQLTPRAPIAELVKIFQQARSRVIVVAKRPLDFGAEETFRSSGLDLLSALNACSMLVQKINPTLNAPGLAEALVKPMYAFKSAPEKFNLSSLEERVKDVLARLSGNNAPTIQEVNSAILYALGASKEGYDLNSIINSSIFVDTMSTVQEKVKNDSNYYFKESKGLKGAFREGELKKLAEIKKLEEITIHLIRNDEAKHAHAQLRARIKDSRRRLSQIQKELDPNPALQNVRTTRIKLITEIAELLRYYGRMIDLFYDLSISEREIFENAPDNNFKIFFSKVKEIITQKNYFTNLQNLDAVQMTLRNDAEVYLPVEIVTMLDRYPMWHPTAYFSAATGRVFTQQFGGRHSLDPSLIADVDNYFAQLGQIEIPPTGMHPLKRKIIQEYGSLRAWANILVAPNPPPATAQLALEALPHGYYNLPPLAPLKVIRFEAQSVAENYLASEHEGVKKLIPLWEDFLTVAAGIQSSAGIIYQHILETKKN